MSESSPHVQFIWEIAELLRGDYKQSEYGQVILPFTVLRRLDLVLAPTKQAVLAEVARLKGKGLETDRSFRDAAKQTYFCNTSELDLEAIADDEENVTGKLRAYIEAFSPIVREIFEAFNFDQQIARLEKADLLYLILTKFLEADLDPERVPNAQMGDMFEELIRRFSEISNATAGEHFTPREVVRLCAELVLSGDAEVTSKAGVVRRVYDPACGTGGMLSATEELVRERNPGARFYLYGQELNPETWAICRSEMLLRGQDPSNIHPGSTLSNDNLDEVFDLMLANPPFGVDWSKDYEKVVEQLESEGKSGRFHAGLPPKKDGAFLFLQAMLAKQKPVEAGGSRIAIVFNGSPMFGGAAGSGPSEIRRWILENDWLEAVVALPEQLFYNTAIATYVWVLTNSKRPERQGKVQLIDARDLWEPMPKSRGDKRRRLGPSHIKEVLGLYGALEDGERSRICDTQEFMFRRITVERPLRLRYEIDEEAIERLRASRTFENLIKPRANLKNPKQALERGEATQAALVDGLRSLVGFSSREIDEAEAKLGDVLGSVERPTVALRKALWEAVSVRDPEAPVVLDGNGNPKPDPELRDTEHVPLTETVGDYMDREVLPFVKDAWVDASKEKIGTEIPLTRLFYRYKPPRPLEEIDAEIQELENDLSARITTFADHAAG